MGRKVRTKTLRRWGLPLVVGGLLIASLTSAVRRSEDGRRLSQELDRLEVDELIMRDRVATQTARADSLAALPRMEDAAREIGLRRAEDGEVFHLSDPSAGRADEGEAPGVGTR
ncbi:MAG: hypothetical protein ACC682_09700 [Gemmatimonadota bacterium]